MINRVIVLLLVLATGYTTAPALASGWNAYWGSFWYPPDATLDSMQGPWIGPVGDCETPDLIIGTSARPGETKKLKAALLPRASRDSGLPKNADRSIMPPKFFINWPSRSTFMMFNVIDDKHVVFKSIIIHATRGHAMGASEPEDLDHLLPIEARFLRVGMLLRRCIN